MPTLTALFSPTVNSYKRYVPGVWAPLTASWGVENRTCAIRVIPADAKGTRIECTAHFDNSANNPDNADPTKEVIWGDQSWEEMVEGWFAVIVDKDTDARKVLIDRHGTAGPQSEALLKNP